MTNLREVLEAYVSNGWVTGAVGLVARTGQIEVEAVGSVDAEGAGPMARDSIFRIASITKPITSALAMMLVEDGRIGLDDPIGQWLPELASLRVVRTPASPVDDTVPAARQITLGDLLESRCGYGFPSDFSLPAVQLLFGGVQNPLAPQEVAAPDDWIAALARVPMLHQPGEAWLYNTSYDILGMLIARVSGSSLPEMMAERLFEPLRMVDTGFEVPAGKLGRFTSFYRPGAAGGVELADAPDGQWSTLPAFPSGAGGLVSTLDDWHAFARMLLGGGTFDGRRLLSPESVRQMTTDHLNQTERDAGRLFLEGQGWGYGGSVDVESLDPWNVPGRYGWVGGTGTTAHVVPSTGAASILLTQRMMTGPTPTDMMRAFWRYSAGD